MNKQEILELIQSLPEETSFQVNIDVSPTVLDPKFSKRSFGFSTFTIKFLQKKVYGE